MDRTTSKAAKQTAKMGEVFSDRRFWRFLWPVKGLKQLLERGRVGFTARKCVMIIAENGSRTVRGMATVPNRKSRVNNQTPKSVADEIQKLAALKEQGLLTEDEFAKKKQQILENA